MSRATDSLPTLQPASPPVTGECSDASEHSTGFGLKKLIGLLLIAITVLFLLHFTVLGSALKDLQALRDEIDGTGIRNELKYCAFASVLIAIGAPRLIFFAFGGLVFGLVEGFASAMAASIAGSFATFFLIRWLGRDWVATRFGRNRFFAKITQIRPTVLAVFLVRQLPVSSLFINATLALSTVRNRAFFIGSLLGFAPQGIVAVLIGSGMASDMLHEGLVQLIAAAVGLIGFGLWLWRSKRVKKTTCALTSS
jgi:uncharacterized membrane protein YdjX (TVP38/TMEM64 family)